MLARSLLYMAVILLALTSFSACGQQDNAAGEQTAEETPPAEGPSPLTGADIAAQIRSIDKTLSQAGWHAKRSNREAVPLFSDVATLLNEHAAKASEVVKEDLQFSASELTGLGERIYRGPTITAEEMNTVNARTCWALAAFHQEQAALDWMNGNGQTTAAHLVAVADFIYAATSYAGGPEKAPGRDLVKRTKDLAQQMEDETALTSDAVGRQIKEIGQEIRRLSKRLKQVVS